MISNSDYTPTIEIELTDAWLEDWFNVDGTMTENQVEDWIDRWMDRAIELLEENAEVIAYRGDRLGDHVFEDGKEVPVPEWVDDILYVVNGEFSQELKKK